MTYRFPKMLLSMRFFLENTGRRCGANLQTLGTGAELPLPCKPGVHSSRYAAPRARKGSLLLPKETGGDVTHVRFFKLIILTPVPVDADEIEGLHHVIQLKAHVDKTVNQIFVVPLISAKC